MASEDKGILEKAKEKIAEVAETAKTTIFGKEEESKESPTFENHLPTVEDNSRPYAENAHGESVSGNMTNSPFYAHTPTMENESSEFNAQFLMF
uniref:Uncharacterized protein n=2 Tax=Acrobeloides nanus TaxID=290746 RepID=A0A914E5F3_9BILA